MNAYLSNKLKVLSLISIILVVFIHANINIPDNTNFLYENSAFLQYFISQGIARISVPLFFTISGYLYFISFSCSLNDYWIKTKKRMKTLILPYFITSFSVFIIYYLAIVISKNFFNSSGKFLDQSLGEMLDVIFIHPLPYQLWFLRDLIVLVFLSPFIYYLFKYLKFHFIIVLFFLWLQIISFNFYIFSNEGILFFSLGGFLTLKKHFLIEKRKGNFYYLIIGFWVLLLIIKSIYNINYGVANKTSDILLKISIISGIISVWALYDIFIKEKEKPSIFFIRISQYSFFIYLIHEPILLSILKKISSIIIRKSELFTSFFYFFNTCITIALSIIIAKILQKYTPKLYNIMTGGR